MFRIIYRAGFGLGLALGSKKLGFVRLGCRGWVCLFGLAIVYGYGDNSIFFVCKPQPMVPRNFAKNPALQKTTQPKTLSLAMYSLWFVPGAEIHGTA